MSTTNSKNPRAKKLNAIMQKIAVFIMSETYTDEQDAQELLTQSIDLIEKAAVILINNDEKFAKEN